MIVREAVLKNPEVTKLIREHFVPIAIDNVQNPQWTTAEREWLAKRGGRGNTALISLITPGGEVLGQAQFYEPKWVTGMLNKALAKFEPEDAGEVEIDEPQASENGNLVRKLPAGGLAMNVGWKVLDFDKLTSTPATGGGKYDQCYAESVGADRFWISPDEAEALAVGEFAESLKRRISRYHLNYVLVGEMKEVKLTVDGGCITGTAVNDKGEGAQILGHLEVADGRVTRFDLLIKGEATHRSSHGFSAALEVIPKGTRVPVALYFELTDPATPLGRVPPHRIFDPVYFR